MKLKYFFLLVAVTASTPYGKESEEIKTVSLLL